MSEVYQSRGCGVAVVIVAVVVVGRPISDFAACALPEKARYETFSVSTSQLRNLCRQRNFIARIGNYEYFVLRKY